MVHTLPQPGPLSWHWDWEAFPLSVADVAAAGDSVVVPAAAIEPLLTPAAAAAVGALAV